MRRCSFSALRIRTFFAPPRLEATKARGLRSFAAARSLAAGQNVHLNGYIGHCLLCLHMVHSRYAMYY